MRSDRQAPADLAEFFRWMIGTDPAMDSRLFREIWSHECIMERIPSLEIVH
jgi:hypothetical protein